MRGPAGGAAPIQDSSAREVSFLWRDETLRKALAIGEININSESLGALAKGLESAGKRYAENLLFRTIPLNKQFAETLSGLAAR